MVHPFQIEKDWSQIDSFNESLDEADILGRIKPELAEEEHTSEGDTMESDSEEVQSYLAMDEGEIDEEMLANGMKFECVSHLIRILKLAAIRFNSFKMF